VSGAATADDAQPPSESVEGLRGKIIDTLSEWFEALNWFEDTGNATIRCQMALEFSHFDLADTILVALSIAPGAVKDELADRLLAKAAELREVLAASDAADPSDWLASMPADTALGMAADAELFEDAAAALAPTAARP
jgi:hypothetical protein